MSRKQTTSFEAGEADQWYERNAARLADVSGDLVTDCITRLEIRPRSILEIGCANGWRLNALQQLTGARCIGVEPSRKAVEEGRERYPGIELSVGTADRLPFEDGAIDLVLFGFCFYLIDPDLHFRVVAEADRVLAGKGHLLIFDFQSRAPYFNAYHHLAGLKSYKMEFSRYFLAHPAYVLIHRELKRGRENFAEYNQREGVDVLLKDVERAFPENPFPS